MTAQFSERLHYSGEKLALCAESLGCNLQTVRKDFSLEAPSTALWHQGQPESVGQWL